MRNALSLVGKPGIELVITARACPSSRVAHTSRRFFVGMYAPLGMLTPSQHLVHAQDRTVIPEIEPPTRPRPVARVFHQAPFHGIVVHVISNSRGTSSKVATHGFLKRSQSNRRARRYLLLVKQ